MVSVVANEVRDEMFGGAQCILLNWEKVMAGSFGKMDDQINSAETQESMKTIGSTAVLAVVGEEQVIVANCGDLRAVICRGGVAMALSTDHKNFTNMALNENECGVEERLNSFLTQLQLEYAILDRIVYKNKNQHSRGSYFQYLMKMRRDFRLLQSIRLEEILTLCFYVIDGKKPKQKVSALESLNKSMRDNGKLNFMETLLGAARLLSQMVEPMLKAASKISTVLAQSFFMSFSVTVLAIIARLRVLVQQILLDVVSIFNTVSSISHKRQSIKIIQGGVDVFREYYPKHKEMITLECVWELDKFVLIERTQEVEVIAQDMPPIASTVKYASIEAFLGDDHPWGKMAADPKDMESMSTSASNEETSDVASSYFNKEKQNGTTEGLSKIKIKPYTHTESADSHILDIPKPAIEPKSLKRKCDLKSRVAFVSVKKHATTIDDRKDALVQKTNSSNDNPISDVLNTGIPKSSVF